MDKLERRLLDIHKEHRELVSQLFVKEIEQTRKFYEEHKAEYRKSEDLAKEIDYLAEKFGRCSECLKVLDRYELQINSCEYCESK